MLASIEGGYTPFAVDITDDVVEGCSRVSSSCASMTTRRTWPSLAASRTGSSSRTAIWYPRTTGIWQTVWLERVAADLPRRDPLDAARRALGDRLRGPRRRRSGRRTCVDVELRFGERCSPTTRYEVIDARSTGASPCPTRHRRLPQRAALEPGAPDADRCRRCALLRRRRRMLDEVPQLHRAAHDRASSGDASC